jgi:hypothetical protein
MSIDVGHIVCCCGEPVTLCGAAEQNWGAPICKECLRLEALGDFCPKSSLGCEAVRNGEVVVG